MSRDVAVLLSDAAATADDRVGPKAAALATLMRAGLPVPDGICFTAEAYRRELALAGVAAATGRLVTADGLEARRAALAIRLGLTRVPLDPAVAAVLDDAGRRCGGAALAVRSSALGENTAAASFAGQFETFLGIGARADLETAVRACWASLWSARAIRYVRAYGLDLTRSAMPVLVQAMVDAEAAGGAFSLTPDDRIVLTSAWGLGPSVAQGDVVPDRYVLRRDASVVAVERGHKEHLVTAAGGGTELRAVPRERIRARCLDDASACALGRLVLDAEQVLGSAVEIEWAKTASGFWILQARPLRLARSAPLDEVWLRHPALTGQPAGIGWGTGPARIVHDEHDLERVSAGDVVVTRVGGPALSTVLPRAAGVVAELGGSTSHLAALARERGIPAVLGAGGATRRIPAGATVAVDGIAGVVRWIA